MSEINDARLYARKMEDTKNKVVQKIIFTKRHDEFL